MCCGMPGVVCRAIAVQTVSISCCAMPWLRSGIRAVDLEALGLAAVLMGQAHVVEHRACIKQFGIESESATLACQSAPVIDAARVVKQQRRFGVPHQLRDFARELAVGNSDSREIDIHCIEIHCTSPTD